MMSEALRESSRLARWRRFGREVAPGFAVALTIAAAASFVSQTYGGPVMLLALLLGIALNFLSEAQRIGPGVRFSSTTVLRVGVALLGLRIAVTDVVALGLSTLEILVAGVVLTILAGVVVARLIGRERDFGVLLGGATAICGASAALAISSVLPKRPDGERTVIFTVIAVTTLSTVSMVLYPALFQFMGFDDRTIGILLGATIHDVAQVVGAGYAISEEAGDTAVVVKLFRVALLLPVVLACSLAFARAREDGSRVAWPVPGFAIAFAALVLVNSITPLPQFVVDPLASASRFALVAAIAAIGLSTKPQEIMQVGGQEIAAAVGLTVFLLITILGLFVVLGS